jgi:DUF4097 and DUF4098 domain-containing protein YvlB
MRYHKALIIAAVAILVLAGTLVAADYGDRDDEKYQEKFNKTETMAPDGKVSVINISGDITVKTWDKSEVQIDAVKTSRASSPDKAKENAEKVAIEVTKTDGGVRIEAKYPEKHEHGLNVSVDFKLMIPAKAGLDSNTVSGDVYVEKIGGALRAGSVSGDVTVTGAAKGVDAHTVSGDVTVVEVDGDAYLKTVSGDVKAERITGSISSETVSGDISLEGISGAKTVGAKALSGEVKYVGKILKDGRYTFEAHSGDVSVTIPSDSAFEFSAESFSGDIETDFKVELSGKISKKELHGTVNGGGAMLKLETFSGDISLKKD